MRLYILLCFTLIHYNVHSQNSYGIVEYGHKQSMGLGAPIGVDYNATLIFNKNNSKYTFAKDSLEGRHIRESVIIKKDKKNVFVKPKNTTVEGFEYFIDQNNKLLFSRDLGFRYVKEDIPKIEWQILNEKKNIGNFKCIKATGFFRGRKYTAWFTTSIPLSYGPWKLQGLPGLILEAYDKDKEVYFYFKSIKYPFYNKTLSLTKPNPKKESKEWISFSEYKSELYSTYLKNIENGRMMVEQYDAVETTENKMPMKNFYIEIFDEEK